MSQITAATESDALAVALKNFRAEHPATEPISSSVSATTDVTARGVPAKKQFAVQIRYMGLRYSVSQRMRVPEERSDVYYIDAAQ